MLVLSPLLRIGCGVYFLRGTYICVLSRSVYLLMIFGRMIFMEAVIIPFSCVKSSSRMMNLRMDSARDSLELTISM